MPDDCSPLIENLLFILNRQVPLRTAHSNSHHLLNIFNCTCRWRIIVEGIYHVFWDSIYRLSVRLSTTILTISVLFLLILDALELALYVLLVVVIGTLRLLGDRILSWRVSPGAMFRW